ncbi:hypothetical protein, partial [Salmonella enterica]|uniref:hypothetical protein n=1 Tax=Salmonella enterica TaxID=28901 RepID=UPI001F158BC5
LHSHVKCLLAFIAAGFTVAAILTNGVFWIPLTFLVCRPTPARHMFIIAPKSAMSIYPTS